MREGDTETHRKVMREGDKETHRKVMREGDKETHRKVMREGDTPEGQVDYVKCEFDSTRTVKLS